MDHWILRDGVPVKVDMMEWALWLDSADRIVRKTRIGEVEVSTVFVGLDASFGEGPPLLWETMVFGGPDDQDTYRHADLADARWRHAWLVRKYMRTR